MSSIPVAIVMPVHDALPHVQRALQSVAATCPAAPLVVVDDGSGEETRRWLEHFVTAQDAGRQDRPCVLLHNERQQLFTRTVNRGIRYVHRALRGEGSPAVDLVAVVNSDCVLHDNWLKALLLGMEDPRVGLIGYCDRADGMEPGLRESREPDYVAGHCMLLRMRMLEEIGVLCETDTTGTACPELAGLWGQAHYGSDRMLCWRANRAGWKTLDCHCRLCEHAGGASRNPDPDWLRGFDLQPLWTPCDRLEHPTWVEPHEEVV